MEKRKVFLHLGMHKTGTTAFQVFCANHAQRLKELGYLYPEAGRPRAKDVSYGHHLLPWSLTRHVVDPAFWPVDISNFDDIWAMLAAEIESSGCNAALLSSEEFDTLNPLQIRSVVERLAAYDVQPIIYLRRFDELAQAMFTTEVVYNATQDDFTGYLQRMRTPLDYEAIIAPWASDGSKTPVVRFYEPELSSAGVVNELLTLIDMDRLQFGDETKERVNVGGWPWYVVEVCRQMNACNLPTRSVVVKFAFIMRSVVGPVSRYDLIPPSEAARLNKQGLESLVRLSRRHSIPEIPAYFQEVTPASDDSQWQRIHSENHGAIVRVLQQISRLVDPQ